MHHAARLRRRYGVLLEYVIELAQLTRPWSWINCFLVLISSDMG